MKKQCQEFLKNLDKRLEEQHKYFQALFTEQTRPEDDKDVSVKTRESGHSGDDTADGENEGSPSESKQPTSTLIQAQTGQSEICPALVSLPVECDQRGLCPDRANTFGDSSREEGVGCQVY